MDNEKLRRELADLRARVKPPAGIQDLHEQRMIEQRIRHLENYLERTPTLDQEE